MSITSYNSFFNIVSSYVLPYLLAILLALLSSNKKKNQAAIASLNKELTIQNQKLQKYSSQIEELTISTERNRVAQELHDSLGHYLMAISMHLDILEKVKTSPDKSEEILTKTKDIVKDSIKELRNTVFQLKEMKNSTILSESINDLIKTSTPSSEVNFNVNIDNEIEKFSPFIKSVIYKTIQESITNGIKHGKATRFDIDLTVNFQTINFSIRNFGIPSNDIIKSNGLKGITERIQLTRGNVFFTSLENGFLVKATIPVRKEDKID
ncbi:MAG: sensor histidine kinase [Sarcina sp.]